MQSSGVLSCCTACFQCHLEAFLALCVSPTGAESQADPLKVSPVTNINDILNCMLAVSHADSPEHLLSVNVAGFLYAVSIDARKDPPTVTYLVPCPGPLPGKYLLLGAGKMLFPEQG